MTLVSRVKHQKAAGGVVYRRKGRVTEIVLVKRAGRGWGFPKGKPRLGEMRRQTALREVREETGLACAIEQPLGAIEYLFENGSEQMERFSAQRGFRKRPRLVRKRVWYYLMRRLRGRLADHDGEVEEARWVPLTQVRRMLRFPLERMVLREAIRWMEGRGG